MKKRKMKYFVWFSAAAILLAACPLLSGETAPGAGNWSWLCSDDELQITLSVPSGYCAYPEETFPVPDPAAAPSVKPAAGKHRDPLLDAEIEVYCGPREFVWKYPVSALRFPLTITAKWQMCREESDGNPGVCLMPGQAVLASFETEDDLRRDRSRTSDESAEETTDQPAVFLLPDYKVLRMETGYLSPAKMIAFLDGRKEPALPFTSKGFLMSLLLALLGGIALNLTPCVLPLIPVNLAIIGAGKNGEAKKTDRIMRGLLYGAGIAFSYGLLGAIAVLTGSTFGQVDASWIFNLCIALIFAALGLSLFDLFRFDLSGAAARFKMPSAAKAGGIFLLGALSAVLAGACVAPVIAAALLQASKMAASGNYAGLLLPFAVGIGMALPWPFAAAGMLLVPKPGAWMNHVKHILGGLILLLAAYYLWTAGTLFFRQESAEGASGEQAYAQIRNALEESSRTGKPVLLDFGASWCKACTMTEWNTFSDPEVKKELENVILLKIRAEQPSEPETAELLRRFQVSGLPTFLLIRPDTRTARD